MQKRKNYIVIKILKKYELGGNIIIDNLTDKEINIESTIVIGTIDGCSVRLIVSIERKRVSIYIRICCEVNPRTESWSDKQKANYISISEEHRYITGWTN